MPSAISLNNLPLSALRAFEAAARLGSFKAAAAQLFVTPAAISQQVSSLETYLGTPLFERLNRAVRLNATGEALAKEVSAAFAGMEAALLAAAPSRPQGREALVISVVPSFATRWLAPRLERFYRQCPRVDLQLLVSETIVDLAVDGRVDLALRYGPGPYPNVHAERLGFDDVVVPVCSPALRAKLPAELSLVSEPLPAPLLRVTLPPAASACAPGRTGKLSNVWPAWLAATGLHAPMWLEAAESGPLYSVTHVALEAAIAGRGIALSPLALVADDLAQGRLERIGTAAVRDVNGFWLLGRQARTGEPAVRAFVDWTRSEVAASPARSIETST